MSDSSTNKFVARGTTAQRTAFTPVPGTPTPTPAQGYTYWDTDLQALFAYDFGLAAWVAVAGSGSVTHTGTLTSGKAIIGNGSADITVSTLTAQFVGSSSGTAAAASMATSRLLGRTTASSGAVEEISVGTGLTLSGGSLTASGASGGLVLLEQHTASASATLDFTSSISTTYDDYQIDLINVIPATNAANLLMKVSTDGGSTWSASTYNWSYIYLKLTAGTNGNVSGAFDSSFHIADANWSTTSGGGVSGRIHLPNPLNSSAVKVILHEVVQFNSGDSTGYRYTGGGYWATSTAVNAVQFLFSSGNIASGTIRCYGLSH